ncbi:hypothetical protein MHY30_04065 [Microbacterium sp. ACRRU]|uniref:hypothetical protein n=1 Tax=Microbacterium TaxID=33882 RepID=UPI001EF4C05D|nr:hypothetical protein [Microbacterium sp. ACRRU]MCG7416681.1 hypothetical protein [Microbacterium sp. ACRRU]
MDVPTDPRDPMNVFAALFGPMLVIMGVLAYSGRWKGWIAVRRGFGSTMGFAWLYLGIAFTLGACAVAVSSLRPLFFSLCVATVLFLAVALVAMFWLPRTLLPSWYLELRDGTGRRRR